MHDRESIISQAIRKAGTALDRCTAETPKVGKALGRYLKQEAGEQTNRMVVTILMSAMIVQNAVARSRKAATDAIKVADGKRQVGARRLAREWERIGTEVNDWLIFRLGRGILEIVEGQDSSTEVLKTCREATEALGDQDAGQTHEMLGVGLQRLIGDRHVLKTQYTRPASAALMAETVLGMVRTSAGKAPAPEDLKVMDPACGTGALLYAVQEGLLKGIRRSGGDDRAVHRRVMGNLTGLDVMPAAAALAETQLAAGHPDVGDTASRIGIAPFGKGRSGQYRLGSLDWMDQATHRLERDGGGGDERALTIPDEATDIVVMNPPFTSNSKGDGNVAGIPRPAWAAFGQKGHGQEEMARKLRSRVKGMERDRHERGDQRRAVGDDRNGLGSWFLDLAHGKLKEGGILGVIVPLTLLSGVSWAKARAMLREDYSDLVIYSMATGREEEQAFSADTAMAEVMVVARKRTRGREKGRSQALYVNLREVPQETAHAREVAEQVEGTLRGSKGHGTLERKDGRVGATFWRGTLGGGARGAQLRETILAQVCTDLAKGRLRAPGAHAGIEIPVARMEDIGRVGPVHRLIGNFTGGKNRHKEGVGAFVLSRDGGGTPKYPMLWNHACERERRLYVAPDTEGERAPGDRGERAEEVWDRFAQHLHLNADLRLNSQSLPACLTRERTLGGRAWPTLETAEEAATLLWENSTMGLMLRWWESSRQQRGRASMTVTQLGGTRRWTHGR